MNSVGLWVENLRSISIALAMMLRQIQIIRWSSQMGHADADDDRTLLLCYSVRVAEIQSMGLTTKQLRHLEQEKLWSNDMGQAHHINYGLHQMKVALVCE
jgi:hypothetical protein